MDKILTITESHPIILAILSYSIDEEASRGFQKEEDGHKYQEDIENNLEQIYDEYKEAVRNIEKSDENLYLSIARNSLNVFDSFISHHSTLYETEKRDQHSIYEYEHEWKINKLKEYKEKFIKTTPSFNSSLNDLEVTQDLPNFELSNMKEQIRLLNDLGVIDFLVSKYPVSFSNNVNELSGLIAQLLRQNKRSIQPTLNALLKDNALNKNYPKQTSNTKFLIDYLKSKESS